MVKDAKIREILAESSSLDEATTWLVNEANEAGGRDNITVVAFRLEEGEAQAADEGATLVGPSAAEAGLSAEAVRSEAERRRRASLGGAASGAPPRRREPKEKRKRRFPVKSLIAVILLAGLIVGGVFASRQVYFLGTDEGGRIALYRGLPYDMPLNVELYSEVTSTPTLVASLPEDRRDEATGHDLRSRDDAVNLLNDLQRAAASAAQEAAQPASDDSQSQDTQSRPGGASKDRKQRSKGE